MSRQADIDVFRSDAVKKVLGTAKFVKDLAFEDTVQLKVVRSTRRHAGISRIEVDDALRVPGVVRIFTAGDIPGSNLTGPVVKDQPVLAAEKVRCLGDPIALVSADTVEAACEAVQRTKVVYRDLPCITDPKNSLSVSAPFIHDGGNLLSEFNVIKGNIEQGFEDAQVVIEKNYSTTWAEHAYLEPDAGIAYLDDHGRITVVCPTQYVHYDQKEVASVLALPPEQVRIIQSTTGGGFGGRLDITVQCLAALAVFHLRKPVEISLSREEIFLSTSKRHPIMMRYKSAANRHGRLTAVEVDILGDTGAYASFGPSVGVRTAVYATGPYQVPHVKVKSRMVYTNNPWAGAMRGFGVPQVTFAHESQMDLLAESLRIDPIEFRLRNALAAGTETATGQTLRTSVGLSETLNKIKKFRDQTLMPETDAERPFVKSGVGVASMWYGIGNTGKSNPSTAQLEIDHGGEINLFIGAADIGQGSDTVFRQIAAEVLGVRTEEIRLVRADTALTTNAGVTSSSRQTYISGNAVLNAAMNLRQKVIGEASRMLNCDAKKLRLEGGKVTHIADPSVSFLLKEAVKKEGMKIRGEGFFDPVTTPLDQKTGQGAPNATYAFGTHLAEVEVHIKTGRVKINRIVACHDVGKVIHPGCAVGQVTGGVAMGVGYALLEEIIPGKTSSFLNYTIPTSKDMPPITSIFVEDMEPSGPFGAKGLGEPAFIPAAPAILNAIANAIGQRIYSLPANSSKVLEAIKKQNPGVCFSG